MNRRNLETELTEAQRELSYVNGVANQFAEEAEEWRRYAMALLDEARPRCVETEQAVEMGLGSRLIYVHNCHVCQATWRQGAPEEHHDGCALVPALWSDKLAEYVKTPLPQYEP